MVEIFSSRNYPIEIEGVEICQHTVCPEPNVASMRNA